MGFDQQKYLKYWTLEVFSISERHRKAWFITPGERLSNHIDPILESGQWSFSAHDPFLLKEKMGCGRYYWWLEAGGSNAWPFSSQDATKERNLPRLLLWVQLFLASAENTINRTPFLGAGVWWGGGGCCLFFLNLLMLIIKMIFGSSWHFFLCMQKESWVNILLFCSFANRIITLSNNYNNNNYMSDTAAHSC